MVPAPVFGFLCSATDCQVGEVRFYNLLKELAIPLAGYLHLPKDSEVSVRPLKWGPLSDRIGATPMDGPPVLPL